MFDPTIFDNLKVVAEGAVYDLDLDGEIVITNRMDQVDLATLSRYYAITFRKADKGEDSVHGELRIYAATEDLSAEILEIANHSSGCYIEVVFTTIIYNLEENCEKIQQSLMDVWGNRPTITQQISFIYNQENAVEWTDTIYLKFERKINEEQVEDLPVIVDYIVESIERLNQFA